MTKYMCMHKVDAAMERGELPTKELIAKIGTIVHEMAKAGKLLDGNGLHRSRERARVRWVDGAPVIERGPYAGGNELIAHITQIATTGGRDEAMARAIALGTQLAEAAGMREVEIGLVVETWDLHASKRPPNAPYRYLLLVKADAAFEGGEALPASVAALEAQWQADGILQATTTLAPTSRASRHRTIGGDKRWTDGPFAEAKELIAGYALVTFDTPAELRAFIEDYADALGEIEIDCYELA